MVDVDVGIDVGFEGLVDRWTPRRICFSVSSAKKRSTWLIQEAEIGVKWMCQRGRLANQSRMSWSCGAGIVDDEVNVQVGRHVALDRVEEAAELPGGGGAGTLADDLSDLHVERGEQRERACRL